MSVWALTPIYSVGKSRPEGSPTFSMNTGEAHILHAGSQKLDQLLKRVFAIDMATCPQCDGALTILAAIEETAVSGKIFSHLSLPTHAPQKTPARFDAFFLIPRKMPNPFLRRHAPFAQLPPSHTTMKRKTWQETGDKSLSGPSRRAMPFWQSMEFADCPTTRSLVLCGSGKKAAYPQLDPIF